MEQEQIMKGFITNNNYELISIEDGYCKMQAQVTENSLNPYGMAHGGFIFGLADTTAGIAAQAKDKKAVTLNSSIEYLLPISCKTITSVATCIKSGKNIAVYDVLIYDDKENLVAKSTITYFYLRETSN